MVISAFLLPQLGAPIALFLSLRMFSWVAVFQFFICIPLAVPAALAGNPGVFPKELPGNLWDGWMCYLGYNSVVEGEHPDDCWPGGPLYVTLYLTVNIVYNILITLVRGGEKRGLRFDVRCEGALVSLRDTYLR